MWWEIENEKSEEKTMHDQQKPKHFICFVRILICGNSLIFSSIHWRKTRNNENARKKKKKNMRIRWNYLLSSFRNVEFLTIDSHDNNIVAIFCCCCRCCWLVKIALSSISERSSTCLIRSMDFNRDFAITNTRKIKKNKNLKYFINGWRIEKLRVCDTC